MSTPQPPKTAPFSRRAADYLRRERQRIIIGTAVGLILALGVWMVVLNDLGVRLATVGAFIAAILTPLLASVADLVIKRTATNPAKTLDQPGANLGIVVASAAIALLITIGAIWLAPKGISAIQTWSYHQFDSQTIQPDAIAITNNRGMNDNSTATLTLPATDHHQLRIAFRLSNASTTSLCVNAATLKITGPDGALNPSGADAEQQLAISGNPPQLSVQLIFLPETDPTCRLDLEVKSATYLR